MALDAFVEEAAAITDGALQEHPTATNEATIRVPTNESS